MNIGFDIDGVLTNFEKFVATYGCKFLKTTIKNIKISQINDDDIAEMFNCDLETEERFWNEYIKVYCTEYSARLGLAEMMTELRKKHNIIIITNRSASMVPTDTMISWVKGWLEKEKIPYDKIVFNHGSKLQACLDNKIDVMIEDSPKHIKELSQYMNCICFDSHYNTECEGENIRRCYSSYDLYEHIREIELSRTVSALGATIA